MEWLSGVLIIVGLFILRLGVPLAVTLAVAYLLRYWEAKWQTDTAQPMGSTRPPMNLAGNQGAPKEAVEEAY